MGASPERTRGRCYVHARGRFVMKPDGLCFYNNDGHYLESIAKLFEELQVGGFLITPGDLEYESASQYTFRFESPTVTFDCWPSGRGTWSFVKRLLHLRGHLKHTDTVLAMGPTVGCFLTLLLAPAKARRILYSGIAFTPSGILGPLTRRLESVALRRSHAVLCTGKHLQEEFLRRGARHVECTVPLLNLQTSVLDQPPPRERRSVEHLLCVGHLGPRKRQQDLLAAGRLLLERTGSCPVIHLVGRGDLEGFRDANKETIELLGSRLVLHGHISDPEVLAGLYRQADALVICSLAEGFPRVVYEALLHGVPVISTPLPGLTADFTDGQDMLFFPFGNPQRLADCIAGLGHDPDRLNSIVERNRVFITSRLSRTPVEQLAAILEMPCQ
ncbi:MAG: glycosyltransferase family 4 protein [Calditrichaeota bacterium]|nr:glycosyltransferase family 4 protein [Candidatus Cloacimonadota bacterium]MCA9784974.1 glycosyltransferase family 4 protein [Candidatus Cloacimonadota bacterium]MCB1047532.1 glycosyltransferase family 4 protein [Calditrichota bacterium]MCB9472571.1 glycosyltransferase family 4 protein [Candidatus Delongbacteria bacterium]